MGYYGPAVRPNVDLATRENIPEGKGAVVVDIKPAEKKYGSGIISNLFYAVFKTSDVIINLTFIAPQPLIHSDDQKLCAIDGRQVEVGINMKVPKKVAAEFASKMKEIGPEKVLLDLIARMNDEGASSLSKAVRWIEHGMIRPLGGTPRNHYEFYFNDRT